MSKCSEFGCEDMAVEGASLCLYHRNLKNKEKDAWLKMAFFSGSVVLCAAAAVLFFAGDSDDRGNA